MDYRRALLSTPDERRHHRRLQLSRTAVLYGAVAGVAVGGPLLGLMGLTLLGCAAVLIVASPLLLFFSPLLLFVGSVIAVTFVGFGAAGVMALAGLWSLKQASFFLIRQQKGGAASTAAGDGWGMSSDSAPRHEMEHSAGSSGGGGGDSERKHFEDKDYKAKANKEHIANENGIQEVEVQ